MKRILFTLLLALTSFAGLKAMSYEEARQQAWFLTDKMAYELNLTSEQYDRAYEINLDYFLSIRTASDCLGYYWDYRDADLRCILFDWQYNLYATLDYFFRPVRWVRSRWYYPVCDHYRFGYYYFNRPAIYISYRGSGWGHRGRNDRSPYFGMRFERGHGMRDGYHAGDRGFRPEHADNRRPDTGKPSGDGRGNDGFAPSNRNDQAGMPSAGNQGNTRTGNRGVTFGGSRAGGSSNAGTSRTGGNTNRTFGNTSRTGDNTSRSSSNTSRTGSNTSRRTGVGSTTNRRTDTSSPVGTPATRSERSTPRTSTTRSPRTTTNRAGSVSTPRNIGTSRTGSVSSPRGAGSPTGGRNVRR